MMSRDIAWTLGPAGLVALYFLFTSAVIPAAINLDKSLFIEQLILAIVVLCLVFIGKQSRRANWRKAKNWSWMFFAGPLWLAILSPIVLILPTLLETPALVLFWSSISLLVAINEEVIFRGFLLGGLQKWFSPVWAAILSSFMFGLLHVLNALSGAEPAFVSAQMFVAFGTGLVMALVTVRSGSIWPAIFLHFITDAVGITYLGGFSKAIISTEAVPGLFFMGLLSAIWAGFWFWRHQSHKT